MMMMITIGEKSYFLPKEHSTCQGLLTGKKAEFWIPFHTSNI